MCDDDDVCVHACMCIHMHTAVRMCGVNTCVHTSVQADIQEHVVVWSQGPQI